MPTDTIDLALERAAFERERDARRAEAVAAPIVACPSCDRKVNPHTGECYGGCSD